MLRRRRKYIGSRYTFVQTLHLLTLEGDRHLERILIRAFWTGHCCQPETILANIYKAGALWSVTFYKRCYTEVFQTTTRTRQRLSPAAWSLTSILQTYYLIFQVLKSKVIQSKIMLSMIFFYLQINNVHVTKHVNAYLYCF